MDYSFLRFPDFKTKAVTLSYDDGVIFDERLINIMSKNGLKGTFNINSGRFLLKEEAEKEKAKRLYLDSGNEVAVHGFNHLSLTGLNKEAQCLEVIEDRKYLEEEFGVIVKGMAYAYGAYNEDVLDTLKTCGIKYARTTASTESFSLPLKWLEFHPTCRHNNPKLMQLVNEFLKDDEQRHNFAVKPKLFCMWGHSYEFNDDNNWEVIDEFAKKVGNRQDVWYATNMQVCDYVNAYDNLEYSANGKIIDNKSKYDVYLYYYGKKICVKANSTVYIDKA